MDQILEEARKVFKRLQLAQAESPMRESGNPTNPFSCSSRNCWKDVARSTFELRAFCFVKHAAQAQAASLATAGLMETAAAQRVEERVCFPWPWGLAEYHPGCSVSGLVILQWDSGSSTSFPFHPVILLRGFWESMSGCGGRN